MVDRSLSCGSGVVFAIWWTWAASRSSRAIRLVLTSGGSCEPSYPMPYPGPMPVLLPDFTGALMVFFASVVGDVTGVACCTCSLACPFPPASFGILLLLAGLGGLEGPGDTLDELDEPVDELDELDELDGTVDELDELDELGGPVDELLGPVEGLDELDELDGPVDELDELDELDGSRDELDELDR